MPEHLRALVVISLLAIVAFALIQRPVATTIGAHAFRLRRNLWILLTVVAFLSHSYVVFAAFASLILIVARKREAFPLALFFSLLFLLPPASYQVPGFGLVNYLLSLDHIRLMVLVILFPVALHMSGDVRVMRFGACNPDRFLAAYLILTVLLGFRATSFTDGTRHAFYAFTDIFLPYYVASRSIQNAAGFKHTLLAFVVSGLLLAVVGIFEHSRHWLLYRSVVETLDLQWGYGNYLRRAGTLRASASTGQAIVLGYLLVVALGFFLYTINIFRSRVRRYLVLMLLIGGLFSTLSRGPWVGAAALILFFLATGPKAARKITALVVVALLSLPLLAVVPGGQRVIDLLPFSGTVEKENIDYRERLINNATAVIERNPWFGSNDYMKTPEMEEMRQGQGIIDVVNTYVAVTLEYGVVGLSLFLLFFFSALLAVFNSLKKSRDSSDDLQLLGRSLLATLLAILLIIFTVSSISFIPVVYWAVAGLCVAYANMVQRQQVDYGYSVPGHRAKLSP